MKLGGLSMILIGVSGWNLMLSCILNWNKIKSVCYCTQFLAVLIYFKETKHLLSWPQTLGTRFTIYLKVYRHWSIKMESLSIDSGYIKHLFVLICSCWKRRIQSGRELLQGPLFSLMRMFTLGTWLIYLGLLSLISDGRVHNVKKLTKKYWLYLLKMGIKSFSVFTKQKGRFQWHKLMKLSKDKFCSDSKKKVRLKFLIKSKRS